MKFVFERRTQTHDLTHVLSGYGTSFPAEAIHVAFPHAIAGTSRPRAMAEALARLTFADMAPNVGPRRWRQLVTDVATRGEAAARLRTLQFTYIEDVLPPPLERLDARSGSQRSRHPSMRPNPGSATRSANAASLLKSS